MRILFVSNSFPNNLSISPNPSIGGTQRRLDMFIAALRNLAELDVLFYVPPYIDPSPATTALVERELTEYWQTPIKLFLCPRFTLPSWRQQLEGIVDFSKQAAFHNTRGIQQIQAFEQCLERQPDAIFIQRLQSTYPALVTQRPLPPIFYDVDDIEHIKLIRQLRQPPFKPMTSLYYLHVPALWRGECQMIRRAHRTFICSELDRHYLADRWQLPGVVNIPNTITIPAAQPITTEPTLLLMGNYNYPPNIDAANFLIEDVLPLILSQQPNAELLIAGVNPQNIRTYVQAPTNVKFTGFVENLDRLYQRSRIVCCPIFTGGGTRIKMIEAAAYGKPIVATEIGAEGLDFLPSQDYLLADTAQAFADACLRLLQEYEVCTQLGNSARAIAVRQYDVNTVIQRIQEQIFSAFNEVKPSPSKLSMAEK